MLFFNISSIFEKMSEGSSIKLPRKTIFTRLHSREMIIICHRDTDRGCFHRILTLTLFFPLLCAVLHMNYFSEQSFVFLQAETFVQSESTQHYFHLVFRKTQVLRFQISRYKEGMSQHFPH